MRSRARRRGGGERRLEVAERSVADAHRFADDARPASSRERGEEEVAVPLYVGRAGGGPLRHDPLLEAIQTCP